MDSLGPRGWNGGWLGPPPNCSPGPEVGGGPRGRGCLH